MYMHKFLRSWLFSLSLSGMAAIQLGYTQDNIENAAIKHGSETTVNFHRYYILKCVLLVVPMNHSVNITNQIHQHTVHVQYCTISLLL